LALSQKFYNEVDMVELNACASYSTMWAKLARSVTQFVESVCLSGRHEKKHLPSLSIRKQAYTSKAAVIVPTEKNKKAVL